MTISEQMCKAGRGPSRCWLILVLTVVLMNCSGERSARGQPLIVDHTSVTEYTNIPQSYIDKIKQMWLDVPGESHSAGYRNGLIYLQNLDSRFQAARTESGSPEAFTTNHLRISRATWGDVGTTTGWRFSYGEEDWFTTQLAIDRTKAHLTYCNTHNLEIAAMGFGWCWDMSWHNGVGGSTNTTYWTRWAGSSVGGPDGDLRWGLDDSDAALTGNRVSLANYLRATQAYIEFCESNHYPTQVFFTTGPVESYGTGEIGYQRSLKQQRIREFVKASTNYVLFDYADILSWSDAGQQNLVSWTDFAGRVQRFQFIHNDNMRNFDDTTTDGDLDHIGERGALRLGKALWVMMARIAGWNAGPGKPARPTGLTVVEGQVSP